MMSFISCQNLLTAAQALSLRIQLFEILGLDMV